MSNRIIYSVIYIPPRSTLINSVGYFDIIADFYGVKSLQLPKFVVSRREKSKVCSDPSIFLISEWLAGGLICNQKRPSKRSCVNDSESSTPIERHSCQQSVVQRVKSRNLLTHKIRLSVIELRTDHPRFFRRLPRRFTGSQFSIINSG